KYTPIAEYKSIPSPENAIAKIERMMRSKKPVRFIVTGTKINMQCSIESFNHSEGTYDIGDREFTLQLKEYKTASPRKIKRKAKKSSKKR
ncbi:phage baseplate protein, partial [Bacillus pumilus]|uniref:phage baseplate protein n=7 Tax=Bacillaceae TaxID=186817 RepID=UPI0036F497DE